MRIRSLRKVAAVAGVALVATACNYSHTATTLTVVDDDEFTGDDPFVSVIDYSVTVGTASSADATWRGGTGQIQGNVDEGDVLAIPTSVGAGNFDVDYSECERVSNGQLPTVFGQVIVAFEDDFSNQQAAFMGDAVAELESALGSLESLTFADLNDCGAVVNTIAGALTAVTGMQSWVDTEWPNYDEGFFTDDDDLVGAGVTAYVLGSPHAGGLDGLVESAFSAALSGADQAGGNANLPLNTDGRADTVTMTGSGSTYAVAVVLDNVVAP